MVDFESIPHKDKTELVKSIATEIQKYFQNPENAEENKTRIKNIERKQSA